MLQIFREGLHISKEINSVRPGDFIASRTVLVPEDFNGVRHYHDNAHFSFVLKGGCAEVKRDHYERLPGSITWYAAGEPHQMTKVLAPSYHVNFELPQNFFSFYGIRESAIGDALKKRPMAAAIMLKTYRELLCPDGHSEESLRMLLLGLVQSHAKYEGGVTPGWVNTVREILHDRWNEKVTLQELSQACGIHPVTISRYFPIHFLCTFGEYCRMLKINHAISMIRRSQTDLTGIAFACGFADQSHFIRNFKSITGLLPKAWQKI
jgi:AraC family transcriptional regulator